MAYLSLNLGERSRSLTRSSGWAGTWLLLTIFWAYGFSSCERAPQKPAPELGPTVVVRNQAGRDWTVQVELARADAERRQGLMFRWSLAPDHGMLFIWAGAKPRTFWMKNTRVPLDMIFITADKKILGLVENAEPYTETPRSAPGESQYVLEVAGGQAKAHGLAPGDGVYFFGFEP